MIIIDKLIQYYKQAETNGFIPTTIGVTDEEYDEYKKTLKDTAEAFGLVFMDTPTKLYFRGIELKKYGKQHTDSKRR